MRRTHGCDRVEQFQATEKIDGDARIRSALRTLPVGLERNVGQSKLAFFASCQVSLYRRGLRRRELPVYVLFQIEGSGVETHCGAQNANFTS